MYKNPQIYKNLKCIFVHVPKTAGTSIENSIRDINDKNQVIGGHSTSDSLLKHKKIILLITLLKFMNMVNIIMVIII